MKLFEKPWFEIIDIKVNDIITESPTDVIGGDYGDGNGEITDNDEP